MKNMKLLQIQLNNIQMYKKIPQQPCLQMTQISIPTLVLEASLSLKEEKSLQFIGVNLP